jgi:hypothetical protein
MKERLSINFFGMALHKFATKINIQTLISNAVCSIALCLLPSAVQHRQCGLRGQRSDAGGARQRLETGGRSRMQRPPGRRRAGRQRPPAAGGGRSMLADCGPQAAMEAKSGGWRGEGRRAEVVMSGTGRTRTAERRSVPWWQKTGWSSGESHLGRLGHEAVRLVWPPAA